MAQPVDPFIPVRQPQSQAKLQRPQPSRQVRQGRAVNNLPPTSPRLVPPAPRPVPPSVSAQAHPALHPRRERRWAYYARLVLACIIMLAIGSLAQIAVAGEILIGIYAVWALVTKVPSRTTFLLALGTFGAILILLIIRPDQVLMRNFAAYAFLFLLVGTLSLAREAHD